MSPRAVRLAGLGLTLLYALFILWIYASQPRTFAEVTGGMASSIGAYRIDQTSYDEGLVFFRRDQFEEARAAFARADPARQDPRTQFYVAYSYYRQGWGRLYNDDELFSRGLEAVDRAIAVSRDKRVVVDDVNLGMRSSDELRAELQRGLVREMSDLNPMRLFRKRQ